MKQVLTRCFPILQVHQLSLCCQSLWYSENCLFRFCFSFPVPLALALALASLQLQQLMSRQRLFPGPLTPGFSSITSRLGLTLANYFVKRQCTLAFFCQLELEVLLVPMQSKAHSFSWDPAIIKFTFANKYSLILRCHRIFVRERQQAFGAFASSQYIMLVGMSRITCITCAREPSQTHRSSHRAFKLQPCDGLLLGPAGLRL